MRIPSSNRKEYFGIVHYVYRDKLFEYEQKKHKDIQKENIERREQLRGILLQFNEYGKQNLRFTVNYDRGTRIINKIFYADDYAKK